MFCCSCLGRLCVFKKCRIGMKFGSYVPYKYESISGVGFSIWRHTFKVAVMTSFHATKCCRFVSAHEASTGAYAAASAGSSSIVHSHLLYISIASFWFIFFAVLYHAAVRPLATSHVTNERASNSFYRTVGHRLSNNRLNKPFAQNSRLGNVNQTTVGMRVFNTRIDFRNPLKIFI